MKAIVDTPRLCRRALLGAAGAAALAVPYLAACTGGEDRDEPGGQGPADRITYLTGFGFSGRESYAHVAKAKGYFEEANLDVTIEPGAAGEENHRALAGGAAQFTAVDSSGAFIRYGLAADPGAEGGDDTFQIVAAVHQRTLISLVYLESSGISRPRHLEGRIIGVAQGAVPETLFPAYANAAGVEASTVRFEYAAPPELPRLLVSGTVDAIGLFVAGIPGVQNAAGDDPVHALAYSEYITDLYGAVVVTPKTLTAANPDLVRRFVIALMRGLEYAVNNPAEAGQILKQAERSQDAEVAAAELEIMRSYTLPAPSQPVGVMDESRTVRAISVLESTGLVPSGANLATNLGELMSWGLIPGTEPEQQ